MYFRHTPQVIGFYTFSPIYIGVHCGLKPYVNENRDNVVASVLEHLEPNDAIPRRRVLVLLYVDFIEPMKVSVDGRTLL
ncbi:hypothetical protein Tsubulata_036786 [Turnera subulata]|uniref:Uncharacterized protein n=1 Tax=Turnera subulata TaxID=218843 RepID=A0A9Q0GHC6_9ROSI|nr:hypothetical protein Tsubulata_036786 [Turnera subulata]